MDNLKESDLYSPVKLYLEQLGYDVKGEVKDCDMTAIKNDELIVVELKKGFTINLLSQAVKRQTVADSVYVAVPLPKTGYKGEKYDDIIRLCKRLELGLIFVGFSSGAKAMVDVVLHPHQCPPIRKNAKKKYDIITEHNSRTGSLNTGGVNRRKILTAYKESALYMVKLIFDNSAMTVRQMRKMGACDKASNIVQRNYYKWFVKNDDGTYGITTEGIHALEEYKDIFE